MGPQGLNSSHSAWRQMPLPHWAYVVRRTCLVYLFPLADVALHTLTEIDQIHEYTSTLSKGCVTVPGEICKKTSLPDVQQCNQIVVINKEPTPSKFSWVRQQIYWEYFQLHRWWLTYISIGNSRAEGHISEKPTQHDWQETCIPKVSPLNSLQEAPLRSLLFYHSCSLVL